MEGVNNRGGRIVELGEAFRLMKEVKLTSNNFSWFVNDAADQTVQVSSRSFE